MSKKTILAESNRRQEMHLRIDENAEVFPGENVPKNPFFIMNRSVPTSTWTVQFECYTSLNTCHGLYFSLEQVLNLQG